MQTVIETSAFLKAADRSGMSDAERQEVVIFIAANPTAGDESRELAGVVKRALPERGKERAVVIGSSHSTAALIFRFYC